MTGPADIATADPARTARNAALHYVADGYDPAAKGINGRRVAGESFLRGFLTHADIDEAVVLVHNPSDAAPVRALAADLRPDLPLRVQLLRDPRRMAPLGTVYYPSPNYAAELWRRAPYGASAWSLCGVTHTISTRAVMEGWMALRTAPQMAWDAVICTSAAVHAAVSRQFDLIDAHLGQRFGKALPPRPMFPVIPLGVDTAAFAPDPAARARTRAEIGAAEGDVVFATVARLSPHEKFDPIPVFAAFAEAQRRLPDRRLHLLFCGVFAESYSRRVFERGAAQVMPGVGFHLRDGADRDQRQAVLSAGDVFLFPIDNIQETYGLAPVEGMAAGLPVLCSDWDGLRDTVTPEVGFRVPTSGLPARHLAPEALRHHGGTDSYVQYCSLVSSMTEIDFGALVARIVDLAAAPDLRRRMGAAAQARARQVYDWAAVIPQMQALWAEQTARRQVAVQAGGVARMAADLLPVAPSPGALFAAWPTARFDGDAVRFARRPADEAAAGPEALLAARDYQGLKRSFAEPAQLRAVIAALDAAGPAGTTRDALAQDCGITAVAADRILIWLLKYGLAQRVQPGR